jgi:hypothetical protein
VVAASACRFCAKLGSGAAVGESPFHPLITDIDRVGAEIKILEYAKTAQNPQALRDGAISQNGVYATAAIF